MTDTCMAAIALSSFTLVCSLRRIGLFELTYECIQRSAPFSAWGYSIRAADHHILVHLTRHLFLSLRSETLPRTWRPPEICIGEATVVSKPEVESSASGQTSYSAARSAAQVFTSTFWTSPREFWTSCEPLCYRAFFPCRGRAWVVTDIACRPLNRLFPAYRVSVLTRC